MVVSRIKHTKKRKVIDVYRVGKPIVCVHADDVVFVGYALQTTGRILKRDSMRLTARPERILSLVIRPWCCRLGLSLRVHRRRVRRLVTGEKSLP